MNFRQKWEHGQSNSSEKGCDGAFEGDMDFQEDSDDVCWCYGCFMQQYSG